jgi:uroporphyrinogen III methyltransferase/synthase
LVVYMGVRQLESIAARLREHGRDPHEPAAIIQSGTLPDQRVVLATLATIAQAAREAQIRPPALTVFGQVAALRGDLDWFEHLPLHGTTVAVTRARAQASGVAARLRELGGRVLEAPAIRIVALDIELPALEDYDLLCFTSPNGVALLFERMAAIELDARSLAGARVAAIGPGTARALRERGVIADVVPERFVAEGLIEALADVPVRRALVARAARARDVLPDALRERGAQVDVLALYETVGERLTDSERDAVGSADYITFTSSSTVEFFLDAMGGSLPASARLVSIGPVTSAALRARGLEPHVEAGRHDIDGLLAALIADARSRAPEAISS